MTDINFTLADCDEVVRKCLQNNNIRTRDFEIIPRQENNYIFKITTEKPTTTVTLYAKSRSQPPRIDEILHQDFKSKLDAFNSKITPKFFGGKSGLLFFEDFTFQKFQTNPNSFDLKHIRIVLKILAEFHAAAFAYEHRTTKCLKEEYDLEDANFDVDGEEQEDRLWSLLDNKDRLDEIREDLKKKQKSSKFVKVLCHGHLISTNILFHYENGVPDDCRLLNFKTKLYAPPLYDVLQLIFFTTNEDFRRCHYDTLLHYYYKCLEEEFQKYGWNVDNVLTFEDLQSSSYELLSLVKLETATVKKDKIASQELEEILKFSRFTREDCYVIVKNLINTTDYNMLLYDVVLPEERKCPLRNYRVRIKFRQSSEDKIINCYVKCRPKITMERTQNRFFFIYDTLLPKFEDLSINAINDCLPHCHFCKRKDLILEDLSSKDYQVWTEDFDFNMLSLVVRKLAKFHASTLLLEEEMSQRLKISYRLSGDYGHYFENDGFMDRNIISDVINVFPEFTTKFEDRNLSKYFANFSDRFRNVISHGRISNEDILIKFDNKPVDCRFVNCESFTYDPPACDFLSLLYLTTNRQTRIKNEEELKAIYYDELGKIISSYNRKLGTFFSYQEFVESLEICRLKIIIQGLIDKTKAAHVDGEYRREILLKLCENSIFKDELRSNVADLLEMCSMLPKL